MSSVHLELIEFSHLILSLWTVWEVIAHLIHWNTDARRTRELFL